jgi:hypothetical protein
MQFLLSASPQGFVAGFALGGARREGFAVAQAGPRDQRSASVVPSRIVDIPSETQSRRGDSGAERRSQPSASLPDSSPRQRPAATLYSPAGRSGQAPKLAACGCALGQRVDLFA